MGLILWFRKMVENSIASNLKSPDYDTRFIVLVAVSAYTEKLAEAFEQ